MPTPCRDTGSEVSGIKGCHTHHQKSNFLFKKSKKLYKMSNIFNKNAQKLTKNVKFPYKVFL